ncbi:MAG: histidine kinase [Chitinophagales bacterium]|nr:histidine kinase [Chitinophagales bacterium]
MSARFYILLFFLLLKCTVFSQTFPFRQYTTENELANSNVHDIVQDGEGYLWFATDNGASRFDGSKFNTYSIRQGLASHTVTSLAVNEKGEVYAGLKRKGIYKFTNGKFEAVLKEDSASAISNHEIIVVDSMIYSLKYDSRIYVINEKQSNKISNVQLPKKIKPYYILKTKNGDILTGTSNGVYQIKGTEAEKIDIPEINELPILYLSEHNDHLLGATVHDIYYIKNNVVEKKESLSLQPGQKINNFLLDKYDNLWISTSYGDNFYVRTNGEIISLQNKLRLTGTSVNDIMQDNEGNVWVATYGRGIFCFYHMFCTNYDDRDGLQVPYITTVQKGNNNDLFVGTHNGLLYFNGKSFIPLKKLQNEKEQILHTSLYGNTLYVCKGDDIDHINNHIPDIPYTIEWKTGSIFMKENDSTIYRAKSNNTFYFSSGDGIDSLQLQKTPSLNRIQVIYRYDQQTIYCGTNNGLYKIVNNQSVEKLQQPELQHTITGIIKDDEGILWVGTQLGLLKLQNGIIDTTWSRKSREIRSVTCIETDHHNRKWVGTLKGLFLIHKNQIISINSRAGLLNEEITSLVYDAKQNVLWIGTYAGLSKINITLFDGLQSFAPEVLFRNIRTQDGIFKIENNITLPHDRNNFTIRFSAIHFTNPSGINFYFQLDNDPWQTANGRQVEFAGLPYGKHTLTLVAENDRGLRGKPETFEITIETPYWASWWFKSLIGITLLSVAFFIIRWRFLYEKKKQQEQSELQTKISELRHQALNTSMNPHFIFNSLNSIQQFINTHNTEEASEYLGKFARLIRMMLDNGGKTYISLEEELDRLNRYLELEKIRFGGKLNYDMQVEKTINTKNIKIPNMILQPFVENALWHGILPLGKAGYIKIDFIKQNGTLKVTIDDDGVGIKESERRNKNKHQSLGMQMILERIQLLKKLNGNNIDILVRDKTEIDKMLTGTRVEISIQMN